MRHYGDVVKIRGYSVPTVDVVIGGSPCQDLSIAGKRAGLAGARSGLFMEQIRVIKEMRVLYGKPRYMVWENVPGAFSSNKGEDFRAVLEETIRITEPNAPDIPLPPKGRWPMADCWYGDGWSVAYRVLDAQFWGVPQRRRRIALVADFGGRTAPEILFVRSGVCGDITESRTSRENTAARAGGGAAKTDGCLTPWDVQSRRIHSDNGTWPALCGGEGGGHGYVARSIKTFDTGETRANELMLYENHGQDSRVKGPLSVSPTVSATFGMGGNNTPLVLAPEQTDVAGVDCRNSTENSELCATLQAKPNGGFSLNCIHPVRVGGAVRRLTPLECERLQGYPDGWTDIGQWADRNGRLRDCTDSARYKALGNSIAIPPWAWVLSRLCSQIGRPATMASLFDGIGGFPLIWERINGKGSCLWASEIEEFPIAVTQYRFGEEV